MREDTQKTLFKQPSQKVPLKAGIKPLFWTKIKHCFCNKILLKRDIKPFKGDSNFIFILCFSTSPASWCLSSFLFLFFPQSPDLLVSLRGSFERRSCIISLLVFSVAFSCTRFCGMTEHAFSTVDKASPSVRNSCCKRLLFSGSRHMLSNVHNYDMFT